MRAILLTAYGDATNLQPGDVPDPTIGADDVEVRMAGASINPIDWKLRSGELQAWMPLVLPAILGRDASGVVVEVGSAVVRFKPGDRVMGLVMGGYAELVVGPSEAWAKVPATLDLIDAAALPLILLTGAQLVEEALRPHRGDVVLVTGAVGSVGRVAVFAAKARGATVWAGVRGSQVAAAATLGADGVVALDIERDLGSLPRLDGIADTVGGPTIERLLSKVKPGGTIGSVVGDPAGAAARGLVVRSMLAHPDAGRLAELGNAVAEGRLVIPIAERLPLSRAPEAQMLAEHHAGAGGKVILTAAAA